jgi:hypothetical protein
MSTENQLFFRSLSLHVSDKLGGLLIRGQINRLLSSGYVLNILGDNLVTNLC